MFAFIKKDKPFNKHLYRQRNVSTEMYINKMHRYFIYIKQIYTCLGPIQHPKEQGTSLFHLPLSKDLNWSPFPHPIPKLVFC